ncbi:M23 family metallopeptidase [Luteimonas aquatica]|uniref:M23 family metallopeptidase n=1 Tax=Luteimonas aquatica TaxID=450364 RepID=UPI001F55FD8F|nr:M23 family metallopeptidase [Luteimonas aquatica]
MSAVRAAWLAAASLAAAALALPAVAGQVYRWTDSKGIVHYDGDRPAAADGDVTALPFLAEPEAIARLRLEQGDGVYLAYVDNTLAGPIEVMLHADGDAVVGEPALPARASVPARAGTLVARLHSTGRGGNARLRLAAVPGTPNARPQDYEYAYPLQSASVRVGQGYGGGFSHQSAENHYAVDLAADTGTTVLAAREGTVMQIASDFDKASLDAERFGGRANFVRILHDDGTMAVYAHLATDGVLVRLGQRVRRGQPIGLSGNTGFSTGPHLHFVVQVNRGMRLESIPFRMFGPGGILRFSEARPSEARPGEARPGEARLGEARPGEAPPRPSAETGRAPAPPARPVGR